MNLKVKSTITIITILAFVRCTNGAEKSTNAPAPVSNDTMQTTAIDSVDSLPTSNAVSSAAAVYTSLIIPKEKKARDSAMKVFKEQYTDEQRYKILAINRLDQKNSWRADTLSIPKNIDDDFLSFSPFPQSVSSLAQVTKFVIFSYPKQAFAYYENGKLVKWGPTSMGKKSAQTKRGLTYANWKKELAISTSNDEWKLPYNVNIFNKAGIGWHQYELPGYPASHSCLRMLEADAKFMYDKVETWVLSKDGQSVLVKGTPVLVYGDYGWGQSKPWKRLAEDPNATTVTEAEINEMVQPKLEEIMAAQSLREDRKNTTTTNANN